VRGPELVVPLQAHCGRVVRNPEVMLAPLGGGHLACSRVIGNVRNCFLSSVAAAEYSPCFVFASRIRLVPLPRYNVPSSSRVSKLNQVPRFRSFRTPPVAAAVLLFAHAPALRAQRIDPPKRLDETMPKTTVGQLNVRVQQDSGAPFLNSVTVLLRSPDMSVDLINTTGHDSRHAP
jgi:hypothetical protein